MPGLQIKNKHTTTRHIHLNVSYSGAYVGLLIKDMPLFYILLSFGHYIPFILIELVKIV